MSRKGVRMGMEEQYKKTKGKNRIKPKYKKSILLIGKNETLKSDQEEDRSDKYARKSANE